MLVSLREDFAGHIRSVSAVMMTTRKAVDSAHGSATAAICGNVHVLVAGDTRGCQRSDCMTADRSAGQKSFRFNRV